jgi:hypothetical protein
MPRTKPKEVARRTRLLRQRELHRRIREASTKKAAEGQTATSTKAE